MHVWSRATFWGTLGSHDPGGPGSCPQGEGAERLDPVSTDSHQRDTSCPLNSRPRVMTQSLGRKGHRSPLRGCGIWMEGKVFCFKISEPRGEKRLNRCSVDLPRELCFPFRETKRREASVWWAPRSLPLGLQVEELRPRG